MGVSLHIQRVDGRTGDLPVADISESIKMFEAIPWEEEIQQWERIPDEQSEELRPLFQLFDDAGHALHITAYAKDFLGVAYNFPVPSSPFGLDYEEEGYMGTDQFPRSELVVLIECFYTSDTQGMLSLLGKYPMAAPSEESP